MTTAPVQAPVPFVTALRSRPGVIVLGSGTASRITIRVTLPEQWDTVAFSVPVDETVSQLSRAALQAFGLRDAVPADYVLKLRGWEVPGESTRIADCGGRDGSTFLLTYRRRRPVR